MLHNLCKSLKDLSDVQISTKLNKFKLKITFCAILSYVKANRLNQNSHVVTRDARISNVHKRSLCPSVTCDQASLFFFRGGKERLVETTGYKHAKF